MFAEIRERRRLKKASKKQRDFSPPAEDLSLTSNEPDVSQTFEPKIEATPDEVSAPRANLGIEASVHLDDDLEGLELSEYARKYDLEKDQVWKMVRNGELVARSENGFIYVYGKNLPPEYFQIGASSAAKELQDELSVDANLPPLPELNNATSTSLSLSELKQDNQSSAAVALLLDHLALAREEQRSLLVMSQESIDKITKMSESMIGLKDHLLVEKERLIESQAAQIAAMKNEIDQEKQSNRKLKQNIEDWEMLARSLASEKKQDKL